MRRELKYLMSGVSAPVIHVRSRIPSLTVEHEPRRVSSVYFDSATYESYRMSNSGMGERVKLRLRWYGDLRVANPSVLELKHRLNMSGRKVQHEVEAIDFTKVTWASVRAMMAARVEGNDRTLVDALRFPILIVTYDRHYFVTSNGRIRVTVDTNLRYYDQRHRPRPNFTFDSVSPRLTVLECKLAEGVDANEARILERLGLRWTRFSKYCYGVSALARVR